MQPAPLPRALDVQKFAASREQEVRALQSALKGSEQHAGKYGVGALPRHLRRRTRSHKPYKHAKRPNAKRQRTGEQQPAAGEDGTAAVAAVAAEASAAAQEAPPVWENRRMRRSAGRLQEAAQRSCAWDEASLAGQGPAEGVGAGSSGSPARRLETHVWHAKRLAMTQRWGWLLPEGAAGRGLGSRSFVHQLRTGAAVHDASYWCPLLLEGTAPALVGLLSEMLAPCDSALVGSLVEEAAGASGGCSNIEAVQQSDQQSSPVPSQQQPQQQTGREEGEGQQAATTHCSVGWEVGALLHRAGRCPQGAIAPVRILHLPAAAAGGSGTTLGGGGGGPRGAAAVTAAGAAATGAAAATAGGSPAPAATATMAAGPGRAAQVQLCIWVHVAAAPEAFGALSAAAAAAGSSGGGGVEVRVLNLRRLEVRGGSADAAVAAALFAHRAPQQQQQQEEEEEACAKPSVAAASGESLSAPAAACELPASVRRLQDGEAVQLLLRDPRLAKPVAVGSVAASLLPGPPKPAPALFPIPPPPCHHPRPLPEAAISARRQQLRRQMLALDDASLAGLGLGGGDMAGAGAGASLAAAMEGVESSGRGGGGRLWGGAAPAAGAAGPAAAAAASEGSSQGAAYCPAVLVRHDLHARSGLPGWSLVVPGGWVPPLWLALAFAGAKPAGQREWRWAHTLEGRPFFPHDYPDTQAYAALMAELGAEQHAEAAKRPKGKYTPSMPFPPPWASLGSSPPAAAVTAATGESAAGSAEAPTQGGGGSAEPSWFVARTSEAAAAALWGQQATGEEHAAATSAAKGAAGLAAQPARPVLLGLRQGQLQWRPREALAGAGPRLAGAAGAGDGMEVDGGNIEAGAAAGAPPRCLVEVQIHVVKRGAAREGAELLGCLSPGPPPAAQHPGGGSDGKGSPLPPPAASQSPGGDSNGEGSPQQQPAAAALLPLGFVTSELPRGAPKAGGSLGAACAATLWRLRSVQYSAARRDRGEVAAYVRNPNSSALHIVRLRLLAER